MSISKNTTSKNSFALTFYSLYLDNIDWVIVGGESGPKTRPVKKEWVEYVIKACDKYDVPFFFKQWGKPEFNENPQDPTIKKTHPDYAKGGCQLNGSIFRKMPNQLANSLIG